MIYELLVKLSDKYEVLQNDINEMKKKNLHNVYSEELELENLVSKFKVNLPLKTMEEFDNLEVLLPTSKELQHLLVSYE